MASRRRRLTVGGRPALAQRLSLGVSADEILPSNFDFSHGRGSKPRGELLLAPRKLSIVEWIHPDRGLLEGNRSEGNILFETVNRPVAVDGPATFLDDVSERPHEP